jgi:hypothetical protein
MLAPIITSIVVSMSAPRIGLRKLDQSSEREAQHASEHDREKEIQAQHRRKQIDHVGAKGIQVAMREVYDIHNAENQRESDSQ